MVVVANPREIETNTAGGRIRAAEAGAAGSPHGREQLDPIRLGDSK